MADPAAATPSGGGGAMLKFCTLESRVDIGFWSELAARKLDRYKLSDAPVAVQGTLVASRYAEVASRLELDADAFVDDDSDKQQQEVQQRRGAEQAQAAPAPADDDEAAVTPAPPPPQQQLQRHAARGTLVLSNSPDEFRALDRPALMRSCAAALWRDVLSGAAERDPSRLLAFLIVAHADLKRYCFSYQFAFPALRPPSPFLVLEPGARGVSEALGEARAAAALAACDDWRRGGGECDGGEGETPAAPPPFWLVRQEEDAATTTTCRPLSSWADLARDDGGSPGQLLVAMADPCHLPLVPGWPLRNLLLLAAARWAGGGADAAADAPPLRLRVLCVRDGSSTGRASSAPGRSFVVDVAVPPLPDGWKGAGRASGAAAAAVDAATAATDTAAAAANPTPPPEAQEAPDALGWEPDASGRAVPRELDLSPHLSPLALAEQAVALNLRLMRWRAAPDLELAPIARCRCLLLGAGTLGCALARTLLAWGVRKITFVDSGRVAYSNPVRQSLFEHGDCLEGGKPKAAAAAEALRRIFPGVDASGVEMRIPMPGHADAGDDVEADAARLDALVEEHDAVFLLTDTRESRWLPTLLAAARRRVAVTAALGFDGYVVMRHGAHHDDDDDDGAVGDGEGKDTEQQEQQKQKQQNQVQRVGCYFCQDVVAPADSTRARPLDQQCTVARPGLAPIAGALSAELLAALLQHPLGVDAPAAAVEGMGGGGGWGDEEGDGGGASSAAEGAAAPAAPPPALGPVPHMIRGQLSGFSQVCMSGRAFSQCTACGPAVVRAWRERGPRLAREAAADPACLERLTGLAALREGVEAKEEARARAAEKDGGGGGGGGGEGEEEEDDWVDL